MSRFSSLKNNAQNQRQAKKKQARPKTNKPQPSRPPKKASEMSQDEAAVVIQKQFRGYKARKEYSPLLTGEKMDNEDATFIKQFARKWKAKSIFQVLLMYRAAKHQEIVYMSQQVHLYNQNAVSALQICNKERVSLHNIRTDTTASQFLGKFVPRMWKLPFRLNDMPFVDSSYLCNTLGRRTLTKDDAPWDDPYKRRSRLLSPSGRTTELENRGMPVEEGTDVFSFIQTPYTRDPNYVEVVYSGQPYRKGDHYFTSKTPRQRRASRKDKMAPPAPTFSYNAQPGKSSDFGKGGLYRGPAPSYQPPSPSKSFVNHQFNGNSGNANFRDVLKPVGGNQNRQNPIRELEMKFQQINNNKSDNEDETPTFNFQAMLRKTNHNRASLRRSPEMEMANTQGFGSFPVIPEQRSVNNNSYSNNNNVVFNSNNSSVRSRNAAPRPLLRQDSGDCRRNMSHHYKESVRKARPDEVTTEIAPGIIIQGQVAEL